MRLTSAELDRAAGVLVGLAAGDALGAGYEFGSPPPVDPEMIGGGLGNWEPGEWTDDTQMAICVAEVAATGNLDTAQVAARFLAWYRSGPADVGNQTRAVLSRAGGPSALVEVASDYFARHPRNSAGNGSLMRTAPVALAHLGDDEAIAASAQEVSALTHGDPLAGEACLLWCIALDRAVREARLDGVRDGLVLLPQARRQQWATWLEEAERLPPRSFVPNGFVVTALQAAYAAITQSAVPAGTGASTHLVVGIRTAVGIGDDTDTVAAIAGSLLGGRWGASAVPSEWTDLLQGWPGYRTSDLVRLAVSAARRGRQTAT